jgi:hypothetical protein
MKPANIHTHSSLVHCGKKAESKKRDVSAALDVTLGGVLLMFNPKRQREREGRCRKSILNIYDALA